MSERPLYTRRTFMTRSAGMLSIASTVPAFLDRSAFALANDHDANPGKTQHPERVLVVVQLAGGNDGLNMIVPTSNDDYYKARPKIAVPKKSALKLDDDFGLHPNAAGLKKIFDAGNLAVLHAVGYPNPNRSHFRATDIWTTAQPESVAKGGWLGKYCDACCAGQDPGPEPTKSKTKNTPDPATAIALEMEPPNALIGKEYIPLTFRSPENLAYKGARDNKAQSAFDKLNAGAPVRPDMENMNDDDHRPPAIPMGTTGSLTQDDDAAKFLQRSALNARLYASRIQKSTAAIHNLAVYPTSAFAEDLKLVAQMIASDLPTRIYYVKLGGFDTHSGQTQRHEKLMTELAAGLSSFMDDLKALNQLDRVTVMTFSEFGRRVNENGSAGTDHGEAAPLLVLSGNIKPGLLGTFPSLAPAKLHRGDVPYTTDFRSLYATLLQDWLKTDPTKILGKPFKTLDLIKPA